MSRYIIISAFFLLVLIIFLAFNADIYDVEIVPYADMKTIKKVEQIKTAEQHEIAVVVDSDSNEDVKKNVLLTLSLLHHNYAVYDSIQDAAHVKTIIVTTPNIGDHDVESIKTFLANGGGIILTVLPNDMTEEVMDLLGITDYAPDYEIEGYDIYEGILLGDMFRTEEFSFRCAKVKLLGKCKVFANGLDPKRDKKALVIDRKDENPLIWRTYYDDGRMVVINAPFFVTDAACIGILTGSLSLVTEDFIYPVVGTKTVVLDNYPYIGVDSARINERTYHVYMRDIIWPYLISLSKKSDITFTCYTNGNFSESKDSYDIIKFSVNELYKIMNGELGYSINDELGFAASERDMTFISKYFPRYNVQSFKSQSEADISKMTRIADVTSILRTDWTNSFEWVNEQAVTLPVISSGLYDEHSDLMFRSGVSTLGFTMHRIDMKPFFTGEEVWNRYSRDLSDYIYYAFHKLDFLEAVPVKRAAEAVKDYLNLEMVVKNEEQSIHVSMSGNSGEISFLLRTVKSIDAKKSVNCSVLEIEDNVYMIKSTGSEFVIWLDQSIKE